MGYDMVSQIVDWGRHGWSSLSRDLCQQPSGGRLEMASKNFLYSEIPNSGENLQNDITARL